MINLFPKETRPYYIVAPDYTHTSSGVRTLHLLCHALNETGHKAYIYPWQGQGVLNPFLNTSICDPYDDKYYVESNLKPIVVYPDIIKGNPLNAGSVVRYLLAPAGAYGGDSEFPETDMIWGALPSIAKNVLRLPVSDPSIFYPSAWAIDKRKSCFYSHKYDRIHGNKLLPLTANSVRLEGSLHEIASILRSSQVCYLYEVSSILTEAALCGCPVELVRTPYFNSIDPSCMMGNVLWAGGEVVKVCEDFPMEYAKIVDDFELQLKYFVKKTQEIA